LSSHTLDRGSSLWAWALEIKTPALEKASRTGHPKFKILTQNGRMGVVFDGRAEMILWKAKGRATRQMQVRELVSGAIE
jgi:hypothetical protein